MIALMAMLTEEEAKGLTVEIVDLSRQHEKCTARLRTVLLAFRDGRGWKAMGYRSWISWAEREVPQLGRSQLYRQLTAAEVDAEVGEVLPESQARELSKVSPGRRKATLDQSRQELVTVADTDPYGPVWETAGALRVSIRTLRQIRGQLQTLRYGPGGHYIPLAQVNQWLTSAIQELLVATPANLCSHCNGESPDSCEDCHGLGWAPKSTKAKASQS